MQQVEVPVTEETNHTIFMRGCDIFTFDVEKPRGKPRETSKKQDFQSCSTGRLKEVSSSQNSMLMTTSHKVSKDFHVMNANDVSQDDMMVLANIRFSNKKPDSGGAHLNFMAGSVRFLQSLLSSSRAIGAGQLVRVQSLDQLFAQAVGMYMILRNNVQDWALHSGGCFQLKGDSDPQFVSWMDVCNQPDMFAKIKWAKLKNLPRTVNKLLGAYGGDVSRLLDVCRERIIFNRVQDLLKCLEIILQDPNVRIVRIKNRLDPAHNAHSTVGYRYLIFLNSSRMLHPFA
jgi:hypothetical protein